MIPITLHYGKDQTLLKLKLETVKKKSVIFRVGQERIKRQNTDF